MLDGVLVEPLKRFADERGFFAEIFRVDWKTIFLDEVLQANLSITYPNVVRAWHKHERGQVDYFIVVRGAAKICVYDDESQELDEIVSTGLNMQVARVPGHYWHGFKAIGDEPTYILYLTNRLYDYENPDELRRPWNDPKVVPKKVNGKADDPRCGKPWDWLQPHYR